MSLSFLVPFALNPILFYMYSSKSDPVTEAEITLVNKEDSEDGTLDSRIRTIVSDVSTVIDLTAPDCDNGNHPLVCATFTTNLLPDDKENKGKQPLGAYMQFKGRGRYKVTKCV